MTFAGTARWRRRRRGRRSNRRGQGTARRVAAIVALAVLAVVLMWGLPILLTQHPRLHGSARDSAISSVRGSLFALISTLGVVIGFTNAAKSFRLNQVGHLTGRFQDAAKLMGDEDPLAKIGGLEAMAQLADEWPAQRQRCIDVLCAHVRLTARVDGSSGAGHADLGRDPAAEDSRRRVLELIRGALVDDAAPGWQGCRFDLRGTVLSGVDLHGLHLCGTTFDFTGSAFEAPPDGSATLTLAGSVLEDAAVLLDRVRFDPHVEVDLGGVSLSASRVSFSHVHAAEATIVLDDARVGARSSVDLTGARLIGGALSFDGASIRGPVHLDDAGLDRGLDTRDVAFTGATIASMVSFDRAMVHREVTFHRATFAAGGGVSMVGTEPPHPRLDLSQARLGAASLVCDDPDRQVEFALPPSHPALRRPSERP